MKALFTAVADGTFQLNPESIVGGVTQSEMTTFDNCSEKWYLRYGQLLQRKGEFSMALHYGSAIHASLEEFYLTKGKRVSWNLPEYPKGTIITGEMRDAMEQWNHVGAAQIQAYKSQYKNDFAVYDFADRIEIEPHVEFEGLILKGKLDGYPMLKKDKGFYVFDHKTCSRLDGNQMDGWSFRFQFMFYVWLALKHPDYKKMPPSGFVINAIKKPELRRKQEESATQFAERVRLDMLTRPESYFFRDLRHLTKGDMQRFENDMLRPKLERLKYMYGLADGAEAKRIQAAFLRNRNTDACFHYGRKCEFFELCKNGWEIESPRFEVRENKHNELGPVSAE